MLSGRALALAVLAKSLIQVTVKRLFREKSGLALFHANYDADRLPPVDPGERERLASFSRCIACGRCDIGEGDRIARSAGRYSGLMSLVLGASRSMPDFDAAATALEHIPDAVLLEKEATCPTGVPFVALASFIRAKAGQMLATREDGGEGEEESTLGAARRPPRRALVTPARAGSART